MVKWWDAGGASCCVEGVPPVSLKSSAGLTFSLLLLSWNIELSFAGWSATNRWLLCLTTYMTREIPVAMPQVCQSVPAYPRRKTLCRSLRAKPVTKWVKICQYCVLQFLRNSGVVLALDLTVKIQAFGHFSLHSVSHLVELALTHILHRWSQACATEVSCSGDDRWHQLVLKWLTQTKARGIEKNTCIRVCRWCLLRAWGN